MSARRWTSSLRWGILPILALVAPVADLHAQSRWDEESPLVQVFDGLLLWHRVLANPDGFAFELPGEEEWDLVVGLFEAGESKTYRFDVTPGYRYYFGAAGDEGVIDIDLCLHDDEGREIRCDTTSNDARPVIAIPRGGESAEGIYQVVLHARVVEGRALAGLIVMVTPLDDEEHAGTPTLQDPGPDSPPGGRRP